MEKLDFEELEKAVGGMTRVVNTGGLVDAVVRSGPGMQHGQIGALPHDTIVNTTGEFVFNHMDGRTWYEIMYPLHGWVDGRRLGINR